MPADMRQETRAVMVVRRGQYRTVRRKPLNASQTISARPVVPEGRISATETKQRVLRTLQRQLVAEHLEGKDHDVRIQEEMQIDMRDAKCDRRTIAVSQACMSNIHSAERTYAGFAFGPEHQSR